MKYILRGMKFPAYLFHDPIVQEGEQRMLLELEYGQLGESLMS